MRKKHSLDEIRDLAANIDDRATESALNWLASAAGPAALDEICHRTAILQRIIDHNPCAADLKQSLSPGQYFVLAATLLRKQIAHRDLPPMQLARMMDETIETKRRRSRKKSLKDKLLLDVVEIDTLHKAGMTYAAIAEQLKHDHRRLYQCEVVHPKTISKVYNDWLKNH